MLQVLRIAGVCLVWLGMAGLFWPRVAVAQAVLTMSAGETAFTAGGGAVAVDPALSMIADDEGRIQSATVSITNFVSGQDVLAATAQHGITVSWDAGLGTLTSAAGAALSPAAQRSVEPTR